MTTGVAHVAIRIKMIHSHHLIRIHHKTRKTKTEEVSEMPLSTRAPKGIQNSKVGKDLDALSLEPSADVTFTSEDMGASEPARFVIGNAVSRNVSTVLLGYQTVETKIKTEREKLMDNRKEEVIKTLCAIASGVAEKKFKWEEPADCICADSTVDQFSPRVLDFIAEAVNQKLTEETE